MLTAHQKDILKIYHKYDDDSEKSLGAILDEIRIMTGGTVADVDDALKAEQEIKES